MITQNLNIRFAKLAKRNFKGEKDEYNPEGNRHFLLILEPGQASELKSDGWNVKQFKVKNPGEEPVYFLDVKVNFDGRFPPKIVLISSKNRRVLTQNNVEMLDVAELEKVDMVIRPHNWEVNGKTGVKAYLKELYATLREDEITKMYAEEESAPFDAD